MIALTKLVACYGLQNEHGRNAATRARILATPYEEVPTYPLLSEANKEHVLLDAFGKHCPFSETTHFSG